MQKENLKEYEFIRSEMLSVKDCITKYVGFALGGAGAAIFGMARMGTYSLRDNMDVSDIMLALSILAPALSIIISFVLRILFYKFHSHNRFAGYCKMLNHEKYDVPDKYKDFPFLAWEMVLEKLRITEINKNYFNEILDRIEIKYFEKSEIDKLKLLLSKYAGDNPAIDQNKFNSGCEILKAAIIGKSESRSWAFPPLVVAMLFFLSSGFLISGVIAFFWGLVKAIAYHNMENVIALIFIFVLVLIPITYSQIRMWKYFLEKLHCLMQGSEIIDVFYWKFIPIRTLFLKSYDIKPEYVYAKESLNDLA